MAFSAFAADTINCPIDSYKVEVPSLYDSTTQVICFKTVNGQGVKHGPEIILDQNKTIINRKYYVLGKEKQESVINKKDISENEYSSISHFIKNLFNTVRGKSTTDKKHINVFTTRNCRGNISDWFNLYLANKKFTAKYDFDKACDIQGSWEPKLNEEFIAHFNLKNISPYTSANVKMVIQVTKNKMLQIDYKVIEGELKTAEGSSFFNAEYTFIVDPVDSYINKRLIPKEHYGKIFIKKVLGKETNIEEKIKIDFL